MQQPAGTTAWGEGEPAAACPWWVQQGSPPFEADEAGWPHAGQVVRSFRRRKRRPVGWPREALRALPATRKDGMPCRTAYTDLLEARAYADLGQYEMSAVLAQEAVRQMAQLHSRLNLAKIRQLVEQLAASPYGSAPNQGDAAPRAPGWSL